MSLMKYRVLSVHLTLFFISENIQAKTDPVSRLTALLEAHKRRSRKYQTPFERKREKEIKSLNSKVEQMKQEKLEKEEEIIDMKINLAEQELTMMEQEIKYDWLIGV